MRNAVSLVLVTGCASLARTTRIRPAMQESPTVAVGDTAVVSADSLRATVYVYYDKLRFISVGPLVPLIPIPLRAFGDVAGRPLRIEVRLRPQSMRAVTFEPYMTRVRLRDGRLIAPVAVGHTNALTDSTYRPYGPSPGGKSPAPTSYYGSICRYSDADLHAGLTYEVREPLPPETVTFAGETCFVLLIPPEAAASPELDLLIPALSVDGRRLQLPAIRFRPETAWRFKWWLGPIQ